MTNDPSLEQANRILRRSSYGVQTRCVIFPIFVPGHWMLGILDFTHQCYVFYDSLHSPRPTVLTTLQRFVDTLDGRQGQLHGMEIPGPQQHNGYDCGVFVCIAAKQFIQTYSAGPFEHDDMAVWRLHILNCIAHLLPLAPRL
ncbi:hypothetical protein H257_16029 [Aphanomyces astaci]|uniref:Ubiquitin-like protease family profile domain-containing protein n=1 Tax=Aphanomyces astaci TaxID=112090 RepID=W4FK69_APHAT|nr:hypothetical protein H257_16029 [Aphanomyces astaci]ETV67907.1 hypothetical protein H257_16029 [Aphanomyces astaci]|eukprot:XP_009842652.1 hypothetical protein H257_16029 [Aphanomyces astaci]